MDMIKKFVLACAVLFSMTAFAAEESTGSQINNFPDYVTQAGYAIVEQPGALQELKDGEASTQLVTDIVVEETAKGVK